jgi:hypothetical protein
MLCSLRRLYLRCLSLHRLYRRRHLRIRGSEQADDLFGQGLVGGEPGELALPEVEIAPGQPIKIGRVILFRGHARTIADRYPIAHRTPAFAAAKRALSHCGIGAKVTALK